MLEGCPSPRVEGSGVDPSRLQQLQTVDPWAWAALAGLVALAVAAAVTVVLLQRRRRRRALQRRYGAEYEHTVRRTGSRRRAVHQLVAREAERHRYEIRDLDADERGRFLARWDALQAGFIEDPWPAVRGADELITAVAVARGYPGRDPMAGVSVDHPSSLDRYRAAGRRVEAKGVEASTEELRRAMLAARDVLETLAGGRSIPPGGRSPLRELLEAGDDPSSRRPPAPPLYGPEGRLLWEQHSRHAR